MREILASLAIVAVVLLLAWAVGRRLRPARPGDYALVAEYGGLGGPQDVWVCIVEVDEYGLIGVVGCSEREISVPWGNVKKIERRPRQ